MVSMGACGGLLDKLFKMPKALGKGMNKSSAFTASPRPEFESFERRSVQNLPAKPVISVVALIFLLKNQELKLTSSSFNGLILFKIRTQEKFDNFSTWPFFLFLLNFYFAQNLCSFKIIFENSF